LRSFLATLRIPDYRRLLISNGLWWQFMWMEQIVMGWLVLEMTDSAWHVALVGFFRMAPLLFLGLVSGSIAERFGRRNVILFSQTVNLIVPVVLILLLATNLLRYWQIGLASAILGAIWAMDWPTRRSILPDLVGRQRTMDGILLEGALQNTSKILGPFLAGVIIKFLGVSGCFVVLSLISGIGLLILLGLSKPAPRTQGSQNPPRRISFIELIRYIVRDQTILGVLLITTVMNNLFFPYMILLPVFARDILGQGPVGLGLLGAGHGVGTFMGLVILHRVRRFWNLNWIYIVGSFFQAAILIAFAFSRSFPLSIFMLMLSGLGQSSFAVLQSSLVLLSASDEMRGRTMGILNLTIGVGSLGRMQLGAMASAFGAPLAVGLACGTAALLILVITAVLPGFRKKTEP
jgi:MFS family permease